MCMCLIPEWNMFKTGIVVSIIGFVILLCIIPIYKSSHPKKEHKPTNWGIVFTWIIGLLICVFNYPVYSYLNKKED